MLNQLQHLIECPSDILGASFDFFDNLKVYKRIFLKKNPFFSCHNGLATLVASISLENVLALFMSLFIAVTIVVRSAPL